MKVAVALITDEYHRLLVTQRPFHVPHGGCWEFPGGKLETTELAEEALIREVKEEVGLDIHQFISLGEINYQYPDKFVQLIIFHVTQFTGKPSCLEGQLDIKWVRKEELRPEDFPEANHRIFDMIPVLSPA